MKETLPVILHCDVNNFYASCECLFRPDLKDSPVAVCGDPDRRHGIILAKNDLAKARGVKTAETIWQARQKCPDLVLLPPHFDTYLNYSRRIRAIYAQYTDRIESFGLDECWLDVTESQGLFGNGVQIAERLREQVKRETGLTISVGVSFTKVFSKLGSDLKKPDAVTNLPPDRFRTLLWKLPAEQMLYIGGKTAEKLRQHRIFTIGDLAKADIELLTELFGVNGRRMQQSARGLDRDVIPLESQSRPVKSVGHGTTSSRDLLSLQDVEEVLYHLSELTATRLRRYGLMGFTVCLHLRDNRLRTISRQRRLPYPIDTSADLAQAGLELFREHYDFSRDLPLRTVTLSVTDLMTAEAGIQQSFFEKRSRDLAALEQSVDRVREKFGFGAITRAILLNSEFKSERTADEDEMLPFRR